MSDTAPVDPAPAPAPVVAPPSGATETPPPQAPPQIDIDAQPESDPMVDPFEYGQQNFPRAYVEQLRVEAANRRVALREAQDRLAPFAEAFDGLNEADRDTLLAFTHTLKNDPMTAADWMLEQGNTIKAQAEAALHPEPPPGEQYAPDDPNRPLTMADFQKMQAEQAQAAQREQLIAHWNREATRLGYDPMARHDAADGPMRWLQFQQLVKMAEVTGGNLEQAHNLLVAQAQGAASAQLQQRVAQVRSSVGQPPPAAPEENAHQPSQSERWSRVNAVISERLNGEPIV